MNLDQEDAADQANPIVGPPRWVKVFAVVGLLVLAALVVMLVSGGDHGPRRHL